MKLVVVKHTRLLGFVTTFFQLPTAAHLQCRLLKQLGTSAADVVLTISATQFPVDCPSVQTELPFKSFDRKMLVLVHDKSDLLDQNVLTPA